MTYVETPALESGLDEIRGAPHDNGLVALIVRRPAEDVREPDRSHARPGRRARR